MCAPAHAKLSLAGAIQKHVCLARQYLEQYAGALRRLYLLVYPRVECGGVVAESRRALEAGSPYVAQNSLPSTASAATGFNHKTSVRFWPFSASASRSSRSQCASISS